jgi:hypothetical protein
VTQIPPDKTPQKLGGFVVCDALRVEHRPHVVGLVIGHVAQVQEQLGRLAMLAADGSSVVFCERRPATWISPSVA